MSDISLKLAKHKDKVMRLLHAQQRMLDKWSDSSKEKQQELWKELHDAGEYLREALGDDYPIYFNIKPNPNE